MSRIPPDRLVAPRPARGRARSPRARHLAARLIGIVLAASMARCAPVVPSGPTPIETAAGTSLPAASASSASAGATPPEASGAPSSAPISPPPTSSAGPTPPIPTPSPAASAISAGPELLLLRFVGGAASLSLVRLSGDLVSLPLPDPSVAAVVPTTNGQLLAVLRDARAFLAPRGPAGLLAGTGWRALALAGAGSMPRDTIISAATSSPDGTRLVAIARPRDAFLPSALVVIEPGLGRRDVRPLADETEGVPPAWIDDSRVAIVQRDRFDRTFLALVTVANGRVTDRLAVRVLDFGTSRDTRTSVSVTHDRIVVGPTASVIELGRAPDAGPAMHATDYVRGGVALSSDGTYLAAAIEEDDSGRSRIAIYKRAGETWRAATRIVSPAMGPGTWLTWLP